AEDEQEAFAAPAKSPNGILTWRGGIGSLAGLIAASDQYVGYDSSGQHIAAALGIPGTTYFSSTNPAIFAKRWAPFGHQSRVIIE
ncbi:MAG: glycosyltransferase family 9 protein, partial [Acidobacteriota bacterium]